MNFWIKKINIFEYILLIMIVWEIGNYIWHLWVDEMVEIKEDVHNELYDNVKQLQKEIEDIKQHINNWTYDE